jgi:hypothetical protein
VFFRARSLSRARKRRSVFPSLSLEKETLEKKEDEEEEMRKQNQCAAKSLVFPSKTTPVDFW